MLERNFFVVTRKAKLFSSRHSFQIRDYEGKEIGTAEQSTGFFAKLLGGLKGGPSTKIEFRESPGGKLLFTVRRRGIISNKTEVVDANGAVLGRYYSKRFSLSGGFHVYDESGKHIAEIRGKMLKFEYTFFTPDGKTEMGKVSKHWGGAMKELFTSAQTYGVEINKAFVDDTKLKMRVLGAAVAIDSLMGGSHKGGGGKAEEAASEESE